MNQLLDLPRTNRHPGAGADPQTPPPDAHAALQTLSLLAWCAHARSLRGEFLLAQQCLESAVDALLGLLQRHGAATLRALPAHNPRRGIESIAPPLAHELLGILFGIVDVPEARVLDLAERELKPYAQHLDWHEVSKIRQRMRA